MAIHPNISVREMELTDIDLVADYWLKSNPDFMESLGVDLEKLPSREELTSMLHEQINLPIHKKQSYALIWEIDGIAAGHSNVNNIEYGKVATMHLHLWQSIHRQKGLGSNLLRLSLPFFFRNLQIEKLIVEPFAYNPAPNRTLEITGFRFVKTYTTIPGSLNFEQEVNLWEMTKDEFMRLEM